MKNFLEKYNANKLETSKDEGKLTLDKAKERILSLLTENMRNFKDNAWDVKNRMNKLITDTEKNSIFSLRLGGKRIVRYSLDLLNTEQKLNFLADFYTSVSSGEFDNDIIDFLAKEVDNAAVRKKEANERRRIKKKEERERKAKEEEAKKLRKQLPEQLLLRDRCCRKWVFRQVRLHNVGEYIRGLTKLSPDNKTQFHAKTMY